MLSLFNHYPIFVKSRVLSSMSQSVAHFQIFRRLMKGKFDAYVLVDRSTICNFTVPTLATTIIIWYKWVKIKAIFKSCSVKQKKTMWHVLLGVRQTKRFLYNFWIIKIYSYVLANMTSSGAQFFTLWLWELNGLLFWMTNNQKEWQLFGRNDNISEGMTTIWKEWQ